MATRFLAWIGLVSVLTLLLLWSLLFTFLLGQLTWLTWTYTSLNSIQIFISLIYHRKLRRGYFLQYCWWLKSFLVIYIKFWGYIRGGWQGAIGTTTLMNTFLISGVSHSLPHVLVFFIQRAIQCWKRQTL